MLFLFYIEKGIFFAVINKKRAIPIRTQVRQNKTKTRIVVQLTARSLPIPEHPGSNPVIEHR